MRSAGLLRDGEKTSVSVTRIALSSSSRTGRVVVDHAVDDRVQRRARPVSQQVGALLHLQPDLVELRVTVPHGDDEALADEDLDLSEADRLLLVDPACRLQDHEEGVAVELQLRALMRLDRILDRELVEVELAAHRVELLCGGLVETDPGKDAVFSELLVRVLERDLLGAAAALFVDGGIDAHRLRSIAWRSESTSPGSSSRQAPGSSPSTVSPA